MTPPNAGQGANGYRSEVEGLAHIAIAVHDAEPLIATLVGVLGGTRGEEEMLDGGALRVVFVRLGPVTFELLEPRSPDHTVAKFLEKRGEGLHHVSLEVEDLERALAGCRYAGIRIIDETSRTGAHGAQVAFLHPKSLGGVLLELSQSAAPQRPKRS